MHSEPEKLLAQAQQYVQTCESRGEVAERSAFLCLLVAAVGLVGVTATAVGLALVAGSILALVGFIAGATLLCVGIVAGQSRLEAACDHLQEAADRLAELKTLESAKKAWLEAKVDLCNRLHLP